jgi:rod shape-determining protein MreD
MICGKWEGIWIGVFAGILQDIYFFHGFGINALVNIFMCLIAAYIGENLFKEKALIPIISIFFLGILKGTIVFVLLYIVNVDSNIELILFNSIYNTLIAVIIYKRVFWLTEKPFMRREWKF